jgi:hypothetical protein
VGLDSSQQRPGESAGAALNAVSSCLERLAEGPASAASASRRVARRTMSAKALAAGNFAMESARRVTHGGKLPTPKRTHKALQNVPQFLEKRSYCVPGHSPRIAAMTPSTSLRSNEVRPMGTVCR